VTLFLEGGDFGGEARELVGIQRFSGGRGEHPGAEFDDDPFLHGLEII
jgi:hypothetical protein